MKYDVFISYSRKDYLDAALKRPDPQSVVAQLLDELDKAKITYWIDKKGISGADKFAEIIADAIAESRMFLFISSQHSNASIWTAGEIGTARMLEKEILPFRIDDTIYHKTVIVYLAPLSHIDYNSNGENPFEELIESLNTKLDELDPNRKKIRELKEEQGRLRKEIKQKEAEWNAVNGMKYDVFISYSSKDQKVVEGICGYLESHGIRCFVAYRDIPRGVVWAEAIVDALDESQIMVIAFSEDFNLSQQVNREIELAAEDSKPLLTFRLSDTPFKGAKKFYLKNLNWIDAFPNPSECFGELYSNVCRLLGRDESDAQQTGRQEDDYTAEDLFQKGRDLYDKDQDEEAYQYFKRSAELGYAPAKYYLGTMYYNGYGVSQDYAEAVKWYRKAAVQGYADAQNNLGDMYYYGYGVSQDYAEAVKWYRKAAEQGDASAQNNLGFMYEKGYGVSQDYAEAVKWYRKAAEQGDALGQYNLGCMYYNGYGVSQDYAEAVQWYRKAAEQGDASAQNDLGCMYYNGYGVSQDYAEAVKWYWKAAEQGNADAQYNLGFMYYYGYGVSKDNAEAVKWYRKAAEQGQALAIKKLKEMGYEV